MTERPGPALRVALAYYQAWTSKDIDAAMRHLADDVVCDAPAGRIDGVRAYQQFLGPFAQMLLGTELLAAFGDQTRAVLVYDTRTPPVASAPGAECLTVRDGKIVEYWSVTDVARVLQQLGVMPERTTRVNGLRVVPTGAAHLGSILWAP